MLLLLITLAQAKPLSSAEFEDTAHTMKPGQVQIDVFRSSQFAVTDELELSTRILGLLGGPNLGVEYALQEGKSGALSLRAGLNSTWNFNGQGLSAGVNWTQGGPLKNRFNVSGGLSVASVKVDSERYNAVGTDLYLSYHVVSSKKTTWRFYGQVDPLNSGRAQTFVGNAGFDWNHGGELARVSLGLRLQDTTWLRTRIDNQDGDSSNIPAVLPLPSFDVWFTW